jgi:hypothetical protein
MIPVTPVAKENLIQSETKATFSIDLDSTVHWEEVWKQKGDCSANSDIHCPKYRRGTYIIQKIIFIFSS